jgi:hypothetical protein
MITLIIAASIGASWPGAARRYQSARRATSVSRGSMTMSLHPLARVSASHLFGEPAGNPVYVISGLLPISRMASGASNPCDGADQYPSNDWAVCLPPLSRVLGLKRMVVPMASMRAA